MEDMCNRKERSTRAGTKKRRRGRRLTRGVENRISTSPPDQLGTLRVHACIIQVIFRASILARRNNAVCLSRYAWAAHPLNSIENGAGLPLRPFRTDKTSPRQSRSAQEAYSLNYPAEGHFHREAVRKSHPAGRAFRPVLPDHHARSDRYRSDQPWRNSLQ